MKRNTFDNQTIREEVKRHLEPTALKLRSYSGEALSIVKKVHVRLSRGCYTVDACVQVQMNAPVQALQGTDLQPRLGFHLVDTEDPEQTRDGILKLEQQDPVQSPQTPQELPAEKEGQPIPSAMVLLIQVVKVPAHHAKLVRAKTSGLSFPEGCTIAFQPGDRLHQLTGLVVEDALIPAEISLVISNPGVSPIQLQEGLLLGAAQPAAWLRDFTEPVGTTCEKNVRLHPEMPTEAALCPPVDREPFALDDYKSLAIDRMSEAWQSANEQITKAQKRQKGQHDHHARPATLKSGDRVFVYMPGSRTDKAYKLSRPYHGPYRVVTALDCGVDVRPVDNSMLLQFVWH